jgi:imidazoleglycerol-phosphate dehydratase
MARAATIDRKTSETDIQATLEIDGTGTSTIQSGIPFFDHMLTLFSRHGLFDLKLAANGDLEVDLHHTVEDAGIVLGQATTRALGDKKGIRRYGHAYVPMDETLVRCVIDLSGRPYLDYRAPGGVEPINGFSFQLVEEFLRGFTMNAAANVHIEILYGRDAHHMAEGVFKALGRALDTATQVDPRVPGVPSTKGVL